MLSTQLNRAVSIARYFQKFLQLIHIVVNLYALALYNMKRSVKFVS